MASSIFTEDVLDKVRWDKAAKVSYFQIFASKHLMYDYYPHLTIAKWKVMCAGVDVRHKTHSPQLFCNLNLRFSRLRNTIHLRFMFIAISTYQAFFINNRYTDLQRSYYISDYPINFI